MKIRNTIVLSALICSSCNSNQNAGEKFRSLFPERAFPVTFNSDSVINTGGLYFFEPNDPVYREYLPPQIHENGGFSYGIVRLQTGEWMYIGLISGDGLNPVFFSYDDSGRYLEHFIGYETPGRDEGFYSVETVQLFESGSLFRTDSTVTWESDAEGNPVDSTINSSVYSIYRIRKKPC